MTRFLSYTTSLVTSSAKIARRAFSYALSSRPNLPIVSRISPSTGEPARGETATATAVSELDASGNGAWDPYDALLADERRSELGDEDPLGPVGIERPIPAGARSTLEREMEELRFIRLNEKATLPTRAHDSDAGLDLYAAEGARITPGGRVSVGTGLAVAIPEGLAGLVLPRSGLALKHGIALVNSPGLIDPGYRGEVRVLLLNTDGSSEFRIKPGDRVAQLLLVPIATARPLEADALDSSIRGGGGFGSSGF